MTRRNTKKILIFTNLFLIFALCIIPFFANSQNVQVASADSEYNWGGKTADELWYYGENFLNLEKLKTTISKWNLKSIDQSSPIIIAVVDTGLDNDNEVFDDVIVKNSTGQICGYNSYYGSQKDILPEDSRLQDISDKQSDHHGTGVAGTIAMMIKELHLEKYINIYPIKASFSDEKKFGIDSITKAISWASSKDIKADVINLSLGLLESGMKVTDWKNNVKLKSAIKKATINSILVAAAGNNHADSKKDKFYPAGFDSIISVMAHDKNKNLLNTSNYGNYDLTAPGENIYSATNSSSTKSNYKNNNGTSFASPFVSLAAAMLKLRFKADWANNNNNLKSMPSPNAIARMLKYQNYTTIPYSTYNLKVLNINTALNAPYTDALYEYSMPYGLFISEKNNLIDENKIYSTRLDVATKLNLEANINPVGDTDPELDQTIRWFLIDEKGEKEIGQGKTLNYMPEKGGNFTIKTIMNYKKEVFSDSIELDIKYKDFNASESKIVLKEDLKKDFNESNNSKQLYTTDKIILGITGLEYCNPDVKIQWFVNNQKMAEGNTFEFLPTKAGSYVISAKFGNNEIIYDYTFKAEVKSFVENPTVIATISVSCIAFVILVSVLIYINIRKKKNKNNNEINNEQ